MAFRFLVFALAISAAALLSPVSGQITTPCTPSMITTFSPCMNFLSNSSLNNTAPPADCCNSLKSLMNNGRDCFCLIATGSVPFRIPINQTLAISLPRACNMPGVSLQCKGENHFLYFELKPVFDLNLSFLIIYFYVFILKNCCSWFSSSGSSSSSRYFTSLPTLTLSLIQYFDS